MANNRELSQFASFVEVGISSIGFTTSVGIGKTNPQFNLDVAGDINFTGTFYQGGTQFIASRWSATGSDIYRLSKVGINTSIVSSALTVNGDVSVSGVVTATTFIGAVTGTASSTTNIPNLTGDITSVNSVTSIAAGVIVDADINASAAIVDTKLATIATALKVSNSATTATNANTASAIVARDASGNFSAGTITASLTGTATSTTNIPNLTGVIISNNTTTSLGSFSSANLATALTDKTGSGFAVFDTSPTLVTPVLGSATATSIVVGSGVTINTSGINATGIITASSFAGNASSATFATNAGISTNLKGGVIGNIPYQSAADTTAFLTNGGSGTILQSNGVGNAPTWVTPAAADAITGLTIRDEGTIVGGANSISTLNFVGSIVSVASTAGIATITFLDYVSNAGIATYATNAGVSTFATNAGVSTYATNAGIATFATNAGISTNLKGGVIGNIPYQSAADTTAFLTNGGSGTILQSNGVGNLPTWVNPAAADAITGLTIRDENNIVSGLNSVSTLNFVGSIVSVASTAGIATITFLDYVSNAGIATNLKGGVMGNIPYQSVADTTAFLANGGSGTILQSNGVGNAPTWVTAPPAAAITGLTIRDEGTIVGGANSVSTLNFVGSIVSVASTAGIATITFTAPDPPVGGKFDTSIDNVLYVQPTGTLDIVGVGTITTQITTLPSGSNKFVVHSIHVTNISNGDAEITASFDIDSRKVLSAYSSGGGAGIHTCRVSSASSISIGMGVTGTNIDYNTLITDVSGTMLVFSKPLVGTPSGTLTFIPTSKVIQRLPVPVGSAVELIKQPFILYASDSIRVQATGVGTAGVSTTTATASSGAAVLTVASATNIAAGQLVGGTGISTNTYVGVGYTPASTAVPITRATTAALSSTVVSFADIIVPQDGALHTTIVYQTSTDTSYNNGTSGGVGVGTIATVYYGTGNTYPSIVQSIRVANISDIGDYPVWVGIGNGDTVFSWLAYNMIIPKNSSIELCESPKRLGIGQSIFAYSDTLNSIEIQIAGKQKTT